MSRLDWQTVDRPGFYPDLDADSYMRDPAPLPSLNQSLIPTLLDASPLHAAQKHPRLNPYGKALEGTKATYLGSVVHRLALGKGREVAPLRFPDFKSSSARNARDAALANNRIPVLEKEFAKAEAMARVLLVRLEEALEGRPYQTEVPIVWREQTPHGPVWCRAMLDVWCEDLAREIDLKTTRGYATPAFASRDMAANGYDIQRQFYARGIGFVRPDLAGRVRSETLYVENAPPYGARPMQLDGPARAIADEKIEKAIDLWGQAVNSRTWPSYPKEPALISTPSFYQRDWLERQMIEDYNAHG